MIHEIIYTEHYALILGDEQTKENDWGYIRFQGGDVKLIGKYFADDWIKVIAHRPLTDASILEGVPLLPKFSQEDDVEDLALEYTSSKGNVNPEGYSDKQVGLLHGFIDGYNKAKETYKYTEEDLINLVEKGHEIYNEGLGVATDAKKQKLIDFSLSLQQPKRPKYFECEIEKVWARNTDRNAPTLDDFDTIVKTTTNLQGQTELVGEYNYV
jgi:hypothetical protein